MNVFSISKNDWAGCGYFLSEAINAHTNYYSRAWRKIASELDFPYDLHDLTGQRFKVLYDWADVIHIHDAPGWNLRNVESKATIVTYHGTRYRKGFKNYHKKMIENRWIATVATPDLTQFGLPLLPDVRPDLFDKVRDKHDQFTVCHAPTKRDVKGTKRVIAVCKKVGVKLELIENTPWSECIKRKARCHLVIDQLELGYGCNAIEAWSMGMPVVAGATQHALEAIVAQFEYLPFALPKPNLIDVIARMRDDAEWREDWTDTGRAHYDLYHSPASVAERAIHLYERALKMSRLRAELPRHAAYGGDVVLMCYIGKSQGSQTWFADGSRQKYEFGANDRLRYVFKTDEDFFLGQKTARGKPLFKVIK